MSFRVFIPARYASTRLPGKPLRLIAGKPMIEHVYQRAQASGAEQVIIATDDQRIAEVADGFGATVVMTDADHPSGSDRCAEVARVLGFLDDDIVVNVQGDEPLLPSVNIAQVARVLAQTEAAQIATLATSLGELPEYLDPNVVKVVTDRRDFALYFSRAPIPWARDAALAERTGAERYASARRHIGLYAYRVGTLLALAGLRPTALEVVERLEQLRALEHGYRIVVAQAAEVPGAGVDTEADLLVAERQLRALQGVA